MIFEYCICRHLKEDHIPVSTILPGPFDGHCKYDTCFCPEFKLDNLQFVEDLAKEKGLL